MKFSKAVAIILSYVSDYEVEPPAQLDRTEQRNDTYIEKAGVDRPGNKAYPYTCNALPQFLEWFCPSVSVVLVLLLWALSSHGIPGRQ